MKPSKEHFLAWLEHQDDFFWDMMFKDGKEPSFTDLATLYILAIQNDHSE